MLRPGAAGSLPVPGHDIPIAPLSGIPGEVPPAISTIRVLGPECRPPHFVLSYLLAFLEAILPVTATIRVLGSE
jgi:hypothetical protein